MLYKGKPIPSGFKLDPASGTLVALSEEEIKRKEVHDEIEKIEKRMIWLE